MDINTVDVITVHNALTGGSSPLFGAIQPPVNGGEEKGVEQGRAINAFVGDLLVEDPDANVLVLGDFNEFQFLRTVHPVIDVWNRNICVVNIGVDNQAAARR